MYSMCQVVLKERIELSIQSYQDCVIPFNYKSSWSRHPESNRDQKFRKLLFYPLNYSEMCGPA